jgi:hypothetical protein
MSTEINAERKVLRDAVNEPGAGLPGAVGKVLGVSHRAEPHQAKRNAVSFSTRGSKLRLASQVARGLGINLGRKSSCELVLILPIALNQYC